MSIETENLYKNKWDFVINKAKKWVQEKYERTIITDREWLNHNFDSYGSKSNRVTVFVLNGSPAKGIVIVDYPNARITCIAFNGEIKKMNVDFYGGEETW